MKATTILGLKELLAEWTYQFTYGYSLDFYNKGNQWVGIDRATGKTEIEYTVACRGDRSSQSKSICGITVR